MGSPLFAWILHGADPRMFGAKCESIWFLFSISERCVYSTPFNFNALGGGLCNAPVSELRFRPNRLSLVTFILGIQNIAVHKNCSMTVVSFIYFNLP